MLRLGRVRKPSEIGLNGHVDSDGPGLVPNLASEGVEPLGKGRVLREHEGAEYLDPMLPREPVQHAQEEPAEPVPLVLVDHGHGDLGHVRFFWQAREPPHTDAERLVQRCVERAPCDVIVLVHVREIGELVRAELRDRREEARDSRRRREAGEPFL